MKQTFIKSVFVVLTALLFCGGTEPKKHVVILATGGTIAGAGEQGKETGRSVGAMARRFYVHNKKTVKVDEVPDWIIMENTEVTGVKVIAEGSKIREVQRLINKYPLKNGGFLLPNYSKS